MEPNNNGASTFWPHTELGKRVQTKLTDEHTLEAIDHLLDRIDTLEKAVQNLTTLISQGPGLVAMAGDMVDEAYQKADNQGVNIEERLQVALKLAETLTAPEMLDNLNTFLEFNKKLPGLIAMTMDMADEGLQYAMENGYDPRALAETAGIANTALTKANAAPREKMGLWGLMKALNDPDRQKGFGFFMNFLKYFGQNI